MFDFADPLFSIPDRRGAEDAFRDVRKQFDETENYGTQMQRNFPFMAPSPLI